MKPSLDQSSALRLIIRLVDLLEVPEYSKHMSGMEDSSFVPETEESSSGGYIYDVTLSWNSEGRKPPFVDTLYAAFARSGLQTFADDGVSKSDVQKFREQSLISVIILSDDFSESSIFGEEVKTIVKCSSRFNYLVLPVLYGKPYEVLDLIYNKEAKVGPRISQLMALVLPKDTDIDEPKAIQSFVGFIQEGIKTNKISSWASKVCHLKDSGLSKLPNNMMFPLLKELYLQDNEYLLAIPNSFFEFMPVLQVLDLSRTSIKHLPPSISNLVCLQKLFLRECTLLRKLPPEIQYLKNLEIFDLSGTELIYIPKEIKELYKLECFRMSFSAHADEYLSEINDDLEVGKKIEIVPGSTLSKLSNLKELSICVDLSCKWWGVTVESIILDLGSLKRLEKLTLYFPTVHLLQRLFQLQTLCQNLSDFRFVVGRGDQRVISRYIPKELQDEFETLEKCLKYVNGREDVNEIAEACKYARSLFVDRHWAIDTLSVLKNSVDNIMFCVLVECNQLKSVIDGHDIRRKDNNEDGFDVEKPVLGLLQYLSIHYMKNLKTICAGPFPSGSLKKLQILALNACPNLDVILDVELLYNLVSLKELIVEDCPKVESLVRVEFFDLESSVEFLPCLQKITLIHLPELASISRDLRIAPNLAIMVVYHCPKLKSLSPMGLSGEHLKEIKGESGWWNTLEGKGDQLDIFVPLEGDGLMSQLAEARTSYNALSTLRESHTKQEPEKESVLQKILEFLKPEKESLLQKILEWLKPKENATTTSENASRIENLAGINPKGPSSDAKFGAEEGESNSGNRWPPQEIVALLEIRLDMDALFKDSILDGPLWEDVSRKLAELGYHRNPKKCKEKFENVCCYYGRTEDVRTLKSKDKTYPFSEEFEALESNPPLETLMGSQASTMAALPLQITPGVTVAKMPIPEMKEVSESLIAKDDATTTSEKASQIGYLAGKNSKSNNGSAGDLSQQQQYPGTSMVMQQGQQQQMTYQQPQAMQQYLGTSTVMQQQQPQYMPYSYQQQGFNQQQPQTQAQIQPSTEENKTVRIGDLQTWMDEAYLQKCFSQTGAVMSAKIIGNTQTGQSERFGFIEFNSHAAADKVLWSYNGAIMPNTDQTFRLQWATLKSGKRRADAGSDLAIFVGDLSSDVTDTILLETFASRYTSVKGAKVVVDTNTGLSKGYGFVRFGDENERTRAITEMNGTYCMGRPMRIGVATQAVVSAGESGGIGAINQNPQSDGDLSNTTIFVGGLDSEVSYKELRQTFSQCGKVITVQIRAGKGCGLVQFANRANAEDALAKLNGTVIGKQTVRLSWG